MIVGSTDWDWQDQVVSAGAPERLNRMLSQRYPQMQLRSTNSYFEAMNLAADPAVRAILLYLQPGQDRPASVVAGMREAAGKSARLVLCCTPALEPVARRIAADGADDYVIDPPHGAELDRTLGIAPSEPFYCRAVPGEEAHLEEIEDIGSLVVTLDQGPRRLLDRLAEMIRQTMRSSGVTIAVENVLASAGLPVEDPVLVDLIQHERATVGQITLGPRQDGPYTAGDVERLAHYTRLVGRFFESARRQQQWRTMAFTDELTGLPNRRFLFDRLETLLQRAAQGRLRVTLLIFDVDDFKKYNDEYGHHVGDEIIRDTAQLFRKHCRQSDIVTRYGGDEFVVVFWDSDQPRVAGSQHPTSALDVLERFRQSLKNHEFKSIGPQAIGTLTISGGLATYPWDAGDAVRLIARADEALRQAKQNGKNRIFLVGTGSTDASDVTLRTGTETITSRQRIDT